ncbi:endonuclease [Alkalimarinus alittae]|uniref:Endonuclease n=1 Tax=Alkalimarinus alittae TaxID=2961619 RepID=A0ABY6N507_9ALTE|nr:endonuclease [Alkalimarinus alittae]UZE97095.1 endonuclease [Alkalimarinus alittae]
MIKIAVPFLQLVTLTIAFSSAQAQTKFSDPKETLKKHFWGDLYKDGGITFYCNKPFTKKNVLVTDSHIYANSWARDYLDCGTPRQCRNESTKYRQITSDLHNIVPADSRFELKRKNAHFGELGSEVETEDCGFRRSFQLLQPPKEIKGDIARAILYMHDTYELPIIGAIDDFKRWNQVDPPSEEEIARNKRISEIQGNENHFITTPARANAL